MNNPLRATVVVWSVCLALGFSTVTRSQTASADSKPTSEVATVTLQASGRFDVKLSPQDQDDTSEKSFLGRMSIDKEFHGDLEATSSGQMLGVQTSTPGSAGYVAMELVSGALQGRSGTFVLQHSSTMARGVPRQSVTVVPDSATGQLQGLAGEMTIEVSDGEHHYHFAYTLPALPTE